MSEAVATEEPKKECDLVMKGGITSGVVYPGAIRKIAEQYRFRNLGGASAGAIAAVAAAACEYRRNQGVEDAYDVLGEVSSEISKPGFVLGLFQPRPKAKPAFDVALKLVTSSGSLNRRLLSGVLAILGARRRFVIAATLTVLLWAAVVAIAIWALAGGGLGALEWTAALLLGLVAFPVGAALLLAAVAVIALTRFVGELDDALKETWFGMCSGRTEDGYEQTGLTDWLHSTIQKCAGLPESQPLTFRDLRGDDPKDPDVNLQLITTDLSASRPATLPLPEWGDEDAPYFFDRDEFARLFPEAIVNHMVAATEQGAQKTPDGRTLYPVPGFDLPIVVAARLSLSFPILLATVPFWRADGPNGSYVQHTMSDGGISSNFPIHYFDSLFPGRPTFGLDLQPWRVATDKPVEMSDAPRKAGFSEVKNVGTFMTQILNAARNWRDNMQAELPGYRDRICQIRLSAKEGGLNLNMPADVVAALLKRGDDAGVLITDSNSFDWDRHRITRFWTLMQMLQQSLGPAGFGRPGVYSGEHPGRRAFKTVVAEWQAKGKSPEPPPFDWWGTAITASDAVFELAAEWSDFEADAPKPTPTLRILPRV